eukprot:jgi/Mesvir1/19532/Mv18052-RA.1
MSATPCEELGVSRTREIRANEVRGDDEEAATVKTLTLTASESVVLRPGATPHAADVDGDAIVRGGLSVGAASVATGDAAEGAYWHFDGGQLVFTRRFPAPVTVPGTAVSVSSLASGADTYRWDFDESAESATGAPAKSFTIDGSPAPVEDGVLKITNSSGVVYNMPAGTFTFAVKVIPRQDLSTPTSLSHKELIEYGYADVRVRKTDGLLQFYDGNSLFSTTATVGDQPFHLAITNQGSSFMVYKDGDLVGSSEDSFIAFGAAWVRLNPGYSGWSLWFDDARFIQGSAVADKNTLLYGWKEMYGPTEATYGFRVANDESLEWVKPRGAIANGTARVLARYSN